MSDDFKSERLSATQLNQVSAKHIFRAVQLLLSRSVEHPFSESTHYDVITENGSRLPPKAVFGLAASEALGFKVLPRHFVGGVGTLCFKAINAAGYEIVLKYEPLQISKFLLSPDDRIWIEGHLKFVTHLRRERGSGLALAKKEAFRREYGRLKCERCGLDPAEVYRPDISDACIEVHHKLPLSEMSSESNTRLEDLECLCANCHRIIHREIWNANQ